MQAKLVDASQLDDRLRRTLDNKVSGCESRGFELYHGLQQRDAVAELMPLLQRATEIFGTGILRAQTDMSKRKIPLGTPLSYAVERAKKGLPREVTDDTLKWQDIVNSAWGDVDFYKPSYIVLNKNSNTGAPFYDNSAPHRIESFYRGCDGYRLGEGLEHKMFGGFRGQADSTELDETGTRRHKKRDFAFPKDIYESISKYLDPNVNFEFTEKDGYIFGKTYFEEDSPFLGPARLRTVKAMSYVDNSFPMIMRQTLDDPGQVSEFIWKHRGPEDIFRKVKGKHVFCSDFSNFDQTITDIEIENILRSNQKIWPDLAPYFETEINMLQNTTFTCADYIRPPVGERRMTFYYEYLCSKGEGLGLPSGYGRTDTVGKRIGTAFQAEMYNAIASPLSDLKSMEGKILNCGDDGVTLSDVDLTSGFNDYCESYTGKRVRQEAKKKFLGMEMICDVSGRVIGVRPDPDSFFVNSLCPERQAGTGMRPYPEFGLTQRYETILPYLSTDAEVKIVKDFYAKLTSMIPDFDQLVETQREAAQQGGDLADLLERYGLTKVEEIYYLMSYRDFPREDAEILGILVPSQEIVSRLPAMAPHMVK